MEFKYAVAIGRFQPMHNAHVKIIERALTKADRVIIVIGSHRATVTVKNPFTSKEREQMIAATFSEDLARLSFVFVRDYPYNDNLWIADVQSKVAQLTGDEKAAIIGSYSDDTSYYLASFPQWKPILLPAMADYHATDIRRAWFENSMLGAIAYRDCVPDAVYAFMEHKRTTKEFMSLYDEYEFVKKYKEDWKSAPYPPTFVTVDAVVVKSGHVLVVKRRSLPGRGLYALPGGFVGQRETIEAAQVREVKEETGLRLRQEQRKVSKVFDHPDRSLRGRTITHAALFDLGQGPLEFVKGSDDAASAQWMSLSEVYEHEDEFFEDHHAIIQEMINKS